MTQMQYKQAAATGARLVKRIDADGAKIEELSARTEQDKWDLAFLTAETIGVLADTNGKTINATTWGRDIGMSASNAQAYRKIGEHYAESSQLPTFGEAFAQIATRNRVAVANKYGISPRAAQGLQSIKNLPADAKADLVKELIDTAEPKSKVITAASQAMLDQHVKRKARTAEHKAKDPVGRGLELNRQVAGINVVLARFTADAKTALTEMTDELGPELREALLVRVEAAEEQLAEIRYLAEHGKTPFNDGLESLLNAEGR